MHHKISTILIIPILFSTGMIACDDQFDESQSTASPRQIPTENVLNGESVCFGSESIICDGNCIDPMKNNTYCGANRDCSKYQTCAADEKCLLGQCKKAVQDDASLCNGLVLCNRICIDPKKNQHYCGVKSDCTGGTSCQTYQVCENAVCCQIFYDNVFKEYASKFDLNKDGCIDAQESEKVTEIAESDELFKTMKRLNDLNSYPNLKKIGKNVFKDCTNITNETLSGKEKQFTNETIEELGDYAFYHTGLTKVALKALKTVDSGSDGMTFADCTSLTYVSMPYVKTTAINMFKGDSALTTISMGSLEKLSRGTFEGCTSLKSFKGAKVTTVASDAFKGAGIVSVTLSAATDIGYDENDQPGTTFIDNPDLTQISIHKKGDFHVSPTFATPEIAAKCELVLHTDKKPGGKATPLATADNVWPEGSNLKWKKITYKQGRCFVTFHPTEFFRYRAKAFNKTSDAEYTT